MLESVVKGGREGEERTRRPFFPFSFFWALLPLSLSSPMSKTDGAVCVCVLSVGRCDPPMSAVRTHTHH